MTLSILHISDLHRDPTHPLTNAALRESLVRDFDHFAGEKPGIKVPDMVIVSGDLVTGVAHTVENATDVLTRQYEEVADFLSGLADDIVNGNHDRIVIVPGNHDVSYPHVHASLKPISFATAEDAKQQVVGEYVRRLNSPGSTLRWSSI